MKLPKILPDLKKTLPKNENLLSLTLTPHKILTCVWNLSPDEKVNILSFAHRNFTNVENIINQAAIAIDSAVETAKTDVSKVVFGLSSYWFEEGKLSAQASKILKDMSKDLDLDAQAFVSLATAINHFYKIEHGITPHAVLVGIFQEGDHSFLETHLIKNNQIEKTHVSKSPINIEAISNLIKQLKSDEENLPSKIVVYGSPSPEILESAKKHNWGNTFVHEPKIEHMAEEDIAKAVALAQAADILGHDPLHTGAHITQAENPSSVPISQTEKADAFGFVADEDILSQPPVEPAIPLPIPQPEVTYDNLRPPVLDQNDYAVEINQSPMAGQSKTGHHLPKKPHGFKFKFSLPSYQIINKIPVPKSPKKLAIAAAGIVLALVLVLYVAGQTLTGANVTIKVNPHSQDFDFSAKVIADAPDDFGKGQISGKSTVGTAQGSQKGVATGNKRTGDKSKGHAKILNWDKSSGKTFNSGTELITSDGLKFKTDSDVNVASRSATEPGNNTVNATAEDIGDKYNINSGVNLNIVGFDEVFYSGVTNTSFAGGDEKQVTVVSQQDMDKTEKTLTDSLKDKAKTDLASKSGGAKIYDEATIVKVDKKVFDKKADEEASLVNLDMQISVNAIVFDENGLKNYLAQQANGKIQGNQEAKPQNVEIKDVIVKRVKDTLSISGRYSAGLVPKINEDDIKTKIAGKSIKDARSAIMQTQDVSDVLVNFSPSIPFIDSIPKNKSKIKIKIET